MRKERVTVLLMLRALRRSREHPRLALVLESEDLAVDGRGRISTPKGKIRRQDHRTRNRLPGPSAKNTPPKPLGGFALTIFRIAPTGPMAA